MSGAAPRTALFAMLAEPGHHAPSFRLARELRRRGWRVAYLGFADLRELVERQGFEFHALASDLLPPGALAARAAAPRADEALFRAFLGEILDGALDERLRAARPDIVLCDTFVWYVALRALALGLPVVDLSVVYSQRPNSRVPPVTTPLLSVACGERPARVRAAWVALRLRFLFGKSAASHLLGRFRHPARMHHLVGVFRDVARRSGYPLREGRSWWSGEMGPRLALPEIVLAPRALEFPDPPEERRVYLGDAVDVARREEPLAAAQPAPGRPLVYASLGTSALAYPHAGRFFDAVAGACRARPDWEFVLHVGDHPGPRLDGAPPANLRVAARAPQLALLARAVAFATHGGINSLGEAIRAGVPMVVAPAARDQPGNAARAARQGIAVVARLATLGADELAARLGEVAGDAVMRTSLARLRARVESEDGLEAALRLIERSATRG